MGNLIFRFFVWMSVPYGVAMGLLAFLAGVIFGVPHPVQFLLVGLCSGLCFGLAMTAILVPMHVAGVKAAAGADWRNALLPQQRRDFMAPVSYEHALASAMEALRAVGNQGTIASPTHEGQLHSTTDATFRTFGEKIGIRVTFPEDGLTLFTLTSTPAVKTTLVDYGKNYENIQRMTEILKELVPQLGEVGRRPSV